MKLQTPLIQLVCLFAFCNASLHAFAQVRYSVTDLGALGGTSSWAASININGQIAGYIGLNNGSTHGCLYDGGVTIDLVEAI